MRPEEAPILVESLLPRLEFGWSELYAIRSGNWKYVDAPRPELYDLASAGAPAASPYTSCPASSAAPTSAPTPASGRPSAAIARAAASASVRWHARASSSAI